MENLTAMGPGDPCFSVYYPNCFSVFGFYDDMKDVPLFSKVSYFISGFFSKESADPFFGSTEETFKDKIKEMGLCVDAVRLRADRVPVSVRCGRSAVG